MEGQDLIAIGFVRTSYGVKGDIKVSSYSGETAHFLPLKEVFLKKGNVQKRFAVERVQPEKCKHRGKFPIFGRCLRDL